MIYAYRLKDRNSKEKGRVVEGFTVRHTWQFTSDTKAAVLKKWDAVLVFEAADITAVKKEIDAHDSEGDGGNAADGGNDGPSEADEPSGNVPAGPLENLSIAELKDYAKSHGFDEAEYSKLTRSKLIEYIMLGMRGKSDA